jgi:hypothetical protein
MQPSALFCRTQEAQQRSRAADSHLDNVRNIATNAANAWGKEAVLAERRESRQAHSLVIAAVEAAPEPLSLDRTFSENPDRGFAGPVGPSSRTLAA